MMKRYFKNTTLPSICKHKHHSWPSSRLYQRYISFASGSH